MKNQSVVVICILIAFSAGAIGYSLWSNNSSFIPMSDSTSKKVPQGMHQMPDGSLMGNYPATNAEKTNTRMMGGMNHSMMMVRSEREFLEGMIPHHREAVETAKEVMARGGSTAEIKKLAADIIVAQEKEITSMKYWYQDWYGQEYVTSNAYAPMMRDLSNLNGAALDAVFLEDMIMHHMGAIMMAQSVKPYIEHSEIQTLVKAIITSQTQEVEQMRAILVEL
jgi:uncharacterized protein (DUF305 family)